MKRALVTGATGFIGRNCLSGLLEAGYEVHAPVRRTPASDHPDVRWYSVDVQDPVCAAELVAKVEPTHLLHFAWYAAPGLYWKSAENFRWVQASLNLLQSFRDAGGERVVMAGTCAEYDWSYGFCSEGTTPLRPQTPYGVCKNALQEMLAAFSEEAGLSSAWGRIFFLYGPNEHPNRLVPSVTLSLLKGEVARCSRGEYVRDYLHVEDVARAFVALLQSDVTGPVNIASGRPASFQEIVGTIAAQVGRPDLVCVGAIPSSPNDPPLLVADVRRLAGEVDFRPKYDLQHGLEQTIAWWRDHLKP